MMQTVLTKYWLAIHAALLLFASWAGLFLPKSVDYVFLLWFALLAAEALVLLPTVRKNETLADARVRVAKAVARDPFFYIGVALLGIALLQMLNSGCALVYLPDADIWQLSSPPLPWAPFSVEARPAFSQLAVLCGCVAGGLIFRNSVGKASKRYALQAAAALSGAAALLLVWRACDGVEPYAGLAVHPGACTPGPFFGFWLVLGMGGYADALDHRQRGSELLYLLGFVGNWVGVLFFASALMLPLYLAAVFLSVVYWFVYLRTVASKPLQLKLFLVTAVVVITVAVAVFFAFPDNPVLVKLRSLGDVQKVWSSLAESREIRTAAAIKIWKEHPWVGVGADGFFHFVGTAVEAKDWALLKKDQAYAYGDGWQFLCEFGVLGVSLLGAAALALLVPLCYRARLVWQQGAADGKGRPGLRLPPLVVAGVCATALCLIESGWANPFHSAGLLTSWVLVLAALPSFLSVKSRAKAEK